MYLIHNLHVRGFVDWKQNTYRKEKKEKNS